MKSLQIGTVIAILSLLVAETLCTTYEEDITLSKQQARIFEGYKNQVWNTLPEEWMKDEMFLLRFLRAKNFDASRAVAMLNTHLKWRKQNSMETIHQEDWSDFKDYPYDVNGRDREGRVVMRLDLDDWDVRKQVIAGKLPRLWRYTWKVWDEARMKVMDLQKQGQNVTRWDMVVKLDNINAVQHINPACIPFFVGTTVNYDPNFPNFGDHIFFLNTPGLFQTVLTLVKPMMGEVTRNSLKVYGRDPRIWKPLLHKYIDPSQLPQRYGGTCVESYSGSHAKVSALISNIQPVLCGTYSNQGKAVCGELFTALEMLRKLLLSIQHHLTPSNLKQQNLRIVMTGA